MRYYKKSPKSENYFAQSLIIQQMTADENELNETKKKF